MMEGRKDGRQKRKDGTVHIFYNGLGLSGYAEWKSDTSSFACSSSVVGSQENSSLVFS